MKMCNPIIFKCGTCNTLHSFKAQFCSQAGENSNELTVASGGYVAPLMCYGVKTREFTVACDSCKSAWNERQKRRRRVEAKLARAEKKWVAW